MNKFYFFKKVLLVLICLLVSINFYGQGVAINTTGNLADPSSILDIASSDAGILIPRLTEAQKNSLTNIAVVGLLIYQTDQDAGFWYFDGSNWVQLGSGGSSSSSGISISGTDGQTLRYNGNTNEWIANSILYNTGSNIGINTITPHASASLELDGNTKGLLINRLTINERDNMNPPPARGLLIYNLDCDNFDYFNGTNWIAVNPIVASINISSNPSGPICSGTNVTFTATAVNEGNSPTYQWKLNGNNVGTNSSTYTTSSLSSGDEIICELTSNANCVANNLAVSNSIILNIVQPVTPSVSINVSPSNSICAGASATFTATPTNGGSTPSYQWKLNGINIPLATSNTYTSSSLSNGDVITCELTSSESCVVSSTALSSGITMSVAPSAPASISINASPSNIICEGTNVTFTATPTNGGSAPTYQWKLNGSNITGANSYTYSSSTLSNNDKVSCVLTYSDVQCVSGIPATSNIITMQVSQNPTIANAGPNQTLNNTTSTSLAANNPTIGTGSWSVVSGQANITSPNLPTSTVTGLAQSGTAVLEWTIENPPCQSSSSTVTITTNYVDPCGGYSTLIDMRDNNTYPVISIGNQCWMQANLKYLPSVNPCSDKSSADPRYYVYAYMGNDVAVAKSETNYQTYGALYNWHAAKDACPSGWHLPSKTEYDALITYLKSDSKYHCNNSNNIAKSMAAQTNWTTNSTSCAVGNDLSLNNESGFSALPAGYKNNLGTNYSNIEKFAYFWTSTGNPHPDYQVGTWIQLAYNSAIHTYIENITMLHGNSVRCIRD